MSSFVNIPTADWRNLTNRMASIESMLKVLTHTAVHDRWISKEDAKHLLKIKSDKTLYTLRTQGKISYSATNSRNILYCRESIEKYLKQNSTL